MTTIAVTECEVGMRVMLTDPDPTYNISGSNPAVNSLWECEGTITSKGSNSIEVDWCNGNHNAYKSDELSLICGGICVDLWNSI